MTDHDDEHHPRESTKPKARARLLAAGIVRRGRYDLGLTQAEAAERGHCGERSQRDRELGGCSLGALESIVAQAASLGQRVRLVFEPSWAVAENDNDAPPSLRPLAKCDTQRVTRRRRRASGGEP